MPEDIDDISVAMPILIFPVHRDFRNVVRIMSITLIISFLVAIYTSIVIAFYQGTITEAAVPAKESELGGIASIINLLYMLILVVIVTFLLIWIVRKGKIGLLKIIMTLAIVYLVIMFTPFMISLYIVYIAVTLYNLGFVIPITILTLLVYVFAYSFTIIFVMIYVLSVFKGRYFYARNIVLLLVGVWTAVWLSWNFGDITPIVILLGFSIYDLYSVFRGPLKELSEILSEKEKREIGGSSDRGIMLGLGDIFFYSFAIGYSFAFLNFLELLVVIATIFIGVIATIFILLNFQVDALPALPIPIIAAVILIVVFRFVV